MYGCKWQDSILPWAREMEMIRAGGQWTKKDGTVRGNGLFFHYKRLQQYLWPEKIWHRWNELELECFVRYKYIGEMGAAGSGKTESAATNALADWYCYPWCTTVIVSSTTLKSLNLRIFGTMKRYHKWAKDRWDNIPGHLIEGSQCILFDPKKSATEGRDFRNGIVAVACKKGDAYTGLGEYTGIHNKHVTLVADELQAMPRAFIDSVSNLAKCQRFKCIGIGNPSETTNAHGVLCEPAPEIGGWESGMDQTPKTKTWRTRFPDGVCIQLPGSDSPNMDGPKDAPPRYPFLITRQQLEDDAKIWGVDDWHYKMMDEGMMPKGQGSRRVLTRQQCLKFRAMEAPIWRDSNRTSIGFLDAAYRGVGGDRCVFGELQFGRQAESDLSKAVVDSLLKQDRTSVLADSILALIDWIVIPVTMEKGAEAPEDQIVKAVKDQCERRGIIPQNFFYDAGMRTSLVSAFQRLWSPLTMPLDFGGKPSERPVSGGIDVLCCDYYSKFVTELWYSVRLIVEAGQFRGMTEDVMREGCAREWKIVSGNKIEVETKEEMKQKTGRSPDLFDALVCGCEGARQRGFVIGDIRNKEATETDDRWKRELRRQAETVRKAHSLNYRA